MRRRRRARRIGSPPVRMLARSVRRMSIARAVAALARERRVRRSGVASSRRRHQPVELRELVRLERVEALAPQALLLAGHRQRHLDLVRSSCSSSSPGGAADASASRSSLSTRLAGACRRSLAGPVVRAATRPSRRRRARTRSSPRRSAEHRGEDRVERLELRWVGHEHRAGGPVQPPPGDRPHERERTGEVGGARGGDRHTCLAQPPAEARRPAPADRARPSRPRTRRSPGPRQSSACTSSSRPAARTTSWSSPYLSTDPSVRSTASASSALDAEQAQRRQPVDRLGDARAASGRRCRACARPRRRPATASVCDASLHAPAHDLDLALRRPGSRSSDTGSGA